ILTKKKIKSCEEMFCTRTCQPDLSFDDAINILYSNYDNLNLDTLTYLFTIIQNSSMEVIQCHLSVFVKLIKLYQNEFLYKFIHATISKSKKHQYHFFWLLMNEKTSEISEIN